MNEEEIKEKAIELICQWIVKGIIIALCCLGWWKIIELICF